MIQITIDRAVIEQLVAALETNRVMARDANNNYTKEITPKIILAAITAGREALAQPEQTRVEADEYQYRTKPTWEANATWSNWTKCDRGSFEDYKRTPVHNEWAYEARALFTHPQASEPAPKRTQPERVPLPDMNKRILFECVGLRGGSDMDYYLLGFEAAERAHGITGGEQ